MKFNFKDFAAVISIIFLIILVPLTLAGFSVGDSESSLTKTYGPEMNLKGWVNISFTNEPSNSQIEAFLDDNSSNLSLTLSELLSNNPGYDYICDPEDCNENYDASNSQATKSFNLGAGDSKLVGIRLEGIVSSIGPTEFEIESDAGPSCASQIKLDIFNDGKTNILNNKTHSSNVCSPTNYGCFDSSLSTREFDLDDSGDIYCQRIELSQSPGFRLGAWIKSVSGSSEISLDLYDKDINKKGSCSLGGIAGSSGQEYSCDVNYNVLELEDHYVCLYRSSEGNGQYKIKANSGNEDSCGFYGNPIQEETSAYQIFAQGKQFDSFGTLKVSEQLQGDPEKLSDKIWNYLAGRYGIVEGSKIDCSSGCVIPIKIISNSNQQVTLKNLDVKYTVSGGQTSENTFYDLGISPALLSSDYQKLFLDSAGIKVPSEPGNYTFVLNIGENEVLSENIFVKDVPIIESLSPLETAAGFPTTFTVDVLTPDNTSVSGYLWDFGDNTTEITSTNKAIHLYPEIKNYTMIITVSDTRGLNSSKTFEINVESPRNLINLTLSKTEKNLGKIENYVSTQSSFNRKVLRSVLNLDNQSAKTENLRQRFDSVTNESEYFEMVGEVLELNIPENVYISTTTNSFQFIPEIDFIEPSIIESIGGGEYNSMRKENFQEAILQWQQENVDMVIDFKEFSAENDQGSARHLVNTFEISVEEKKDISYDYYLVIPRNQEMEFEDGSEEQGSYHYVNLKENPQVNIYTTENINFLTLEAFVSPSLSNLDLEEGPLTPKEDSRTLIFVLSLVFLMIVGIISYIVLQQWYKKKYERYLFPNKNDLYNLLNYVNSSKKRGLENNEIRKALKKTDWNSEQINYVMRKYEGKRTGMPELPLTKLMKKVSEKKRENDPNHGGK